MEINGNVQVSCGFEDGEKARVVKEDAFRGAVHQGPWKSQASHAAVQFRGSGVRIFQGKAGKTGEASGMGTHCARQLIVDVADQRRRGRGVERIDARGNQGQDLEVDAGLVHVCNAAGGQIEEFGLEVGKPCGSCGSNDGSGSEVLFKSNHAHE